jgi:hypothetical protein
VSHLYKDDDSGLTLSEQICGEDLPLEEALALCDERRDAFHVTCVKQSLAAYRRYDLDLPKDLRAEAAELGLL